MQNLVLQVRLSLQKPTAIWHNLPWTPSQGPCRKSDRCEAFQGTCRPEAAQRGPTKGRGEQFAGPTLLHPARAVQRDRRERDLRNLTAHFVQDAGAYCQATT